MGSGSFAASISHCSIRISSFQAIAVIFELLPGCWVWLCLAVESDLVGEAGVRSVAVELCVATWAGQGVDDPVKSWEAAWQQSRTAPASLLGEEKTTHKHTLGSSEETFCSLLCCCPGNDSDDGDDAHRGTGSRGWPAPPTSEIQLAWPAQGIRTAFQGQFWIHCIVFTHETSKIPPLTEPWRVHGIGGNRLKHLFCAHVLKV